MNSKKVLQTLFMSLGAFSLVLTSCGKTENTSSPGSESTPPATSPTTVEDSSEPTSVSTPDVTSESTPDVTSESTPDVSSDTSSEDVVVVPESVEYDVDFNFDVKDEGITVWTDYDVSGTRAPTPLGTSGKTEDLEGRHTIGSSILNNDGYYTFAIDADGYITYASYGLARGWGAPCDGYYHNQETKNRNDTDYFVLHDEYADWPTLTMDKQNAWTLYDFVVPTDGFVITSWHNTEAFTALWKQMFGETASPVLSVLGTAAPTNNQFLESTTPARSLDKFYFSLDENKQLSVRERMETEFKDEYGDQDDSTPSKRFESTDADVPAVYDTIAEAKAYTSETETYTIKGVVTSFYANGNVTIIDENGDAVLLYGSDNLGTVADAKYKVGDTVVATGTMTTYNGLVELRVSAEPTIVTKYGKLDPVAPITVTAANVAEVIVIANQSKVVKVVAAVVGTINESGTTEVTVGETKFNLYRVDFPDNVKEGDTIDFTGTISVFNNVQVRVTSSADISRYYNITVDHDGDTETEAQVIAKSTGDSVTVTAATPADGYVFEKWVSVTPGEGEDAEDVLTDVSTSAAYTFTVGTDDVVLKAVYKYSAWSSLPSSYVNGGNIEVVSTTADSKFSVFTGNEVIHGINTETGAGAWNLGTINASWRTVMAVDKDGKIAYLVYNPANGYGGPTGSGYYAHPDYTVAWNDTTSVYDTNNPAFFFAEGYGPWSSADPIPSSKFSIVVPEGGFIVTTYNPQDPSQGTPANDLVNALSQGKVTALSDAVIGTVNSRSFISSDTRVYYDEAAQAVRVYVNEVPAGAMGAIINNTSDEYMTIYDSTATEIVMQDYTVAIDSTGKIIYASYGPGNGYGGPGDGFYHDGTYVVTPGQVCGIFDLHEKFAGYPNTAEVNGETVNAWTLYDVKVPEGGYIITGSRAEMLALVNDITDGELTSLPEKTNALFEGMVDGVLNNSKKINVSALTTYATIEVEALVPTYEEAMSMEGYTVTEKGEPGSATALYQNAINQKGEAGFYVAATSAEAKCFPTSAYFVVGTTVVRGDIVITEGAQYWVRSSLVSYDNPYYVVIIYGETNPSKLIAYASGETVVTNAALIEQVGKAFVASIQTGGEPTDRTDVAFTWNAYTGAYEATITVGEWRRVSFSYTDSEDAVTKLWYDNTTTISGAFTSADAYGSANRGQLYHETGWVGDWMNPTSGITHTISYNPTASSLNAVVNG